MSIEIFKNEWPKRMELYKQKVRDAATAQMRRNTLDLEKEAKNLAPKKEGTLEGDIVANPQVKANLFEVEGEVHAGAGMSGSYAL